MYNSILSGLFEKKKITKSTDKAKYLSSLKEQVRGLRNAYNNYPITFDYKNKDVQASYLITYVPHYTELLFTVLNESKSKISDAKISDIVCFGSGPCPEIIGYLRYLNQFDKEIERDINITVWDISADDWKWSRDIVYDDVVPQYINNWNFNRYVGTVDISKKLNITIDKEKQLVVFQNCLNEISPDSHEILKNNIQEIFDEIPSGSYLALIDLDYSQTLELMTDIEDIIDLNFDCKIIKSVKSGGIKQKTTQKNEPKIITDNLLTDEFFVGTPTGLLPKRNLNYLSALIKKK